jgi:hypothetical protein
VGEMTQILYAHMNKRNKQTKNQKEQVRKKKEVSVYDNSKLQQYD